VSTKESMPWHFASAPTGDPGEFQVARNAT
jgi:hypothetical protein